MFFSLDFQPIFYRTKRHFSKKIKRNKKQAAENQVFQQLAKWLFAERMFW